MIKFCAALLLLVLTVAFSRSANAQQLIGNSRVFSTQDSDSPGQAEAFQTTASANGTVSTMSFYLDRRNGARQVFIGLYSNGSGHPRTLLCSGSTSSPVAGQWNTVAVSPAVAITAGRTYHIVLLGTGGTIAYRDTGNGGHSETSSQTNLASLPNTWSTGTSWSSSPVSAYASAGSGSQGSGGTSGGSDVSITINPTSASVVQGGQQQFSATVSGSSNTGVNWSVTQGTGTVNSSGLFTAPNAQETDTVQAQSQADTTKTATATVTTPAVSISVSPTSATLNPGAQRQFTATVSGTTNTGVTWSVTKGTGTITSSGLFTAPNVQEIDTVQAQSQADNTKAATASVTVSSNISISISPSSATVNQGAQRQFTATVSGTSNTGVNWSVTQGSGTINASGLFTAPNAQESDTVQAQSQADTTKTATAAVTVPAVGISISPTSATVAPNGTQQFTATVTGTVNQGVDWSDTGNGSVTSSGLYAAPSSAEKDTVTATALADTTKSATASVTVGVAQGQCGNQLNWTDPSCQVPGSGTLNPQWTIVSRHGEYAQSETECNVPAAVSAGNGQLVITSSASSYTCGDFNPDGSTRTSPRSWPYTTGDVQWNTFNFQYGTLTWSSTYPPSNTNLWPSHWLLTTKCQNTNKYSGDTGFGGCPNFGSSGYDEVDLIECYRGSCNMNVYHNGQTNSCYIPTPNWDSRLHTWSMVWTSSRITLSRDGTQICSISQGIPQSPMFLIIQTQTGGIGGTPNNSSLPASLTTQYVKVCNTTDGSCSSVADTDPSVTFIDRFTSTSENAVRNMSRKTTNAAQ